MSTSEGKLRRVIIRPEYSAVGAKNKSKPSRAVEAAISIFKKKDISHVCEIGCGLLANTLYLLRAFPHVILTDRKEQYDRIKERLNDLSEKYNSFKGFMEEQSFQKMKLNLEGALVINVIHILPMRKERIELLRAINQNLKNGGIIFIDVPSNETFYRNIVKTAIPYSDGYVMQRDGYYTFYKNMTFEELKEYVKIAGFNLEQRVYLNHRITFTARKVD